MVVKLVVFRVKCISYSIELFILKLLYTILLYFGENHHLTASIRVYLALNPIKQLNTTII